MTTSGGEGDGSAEYTYTRNTEAPRVIYAAGRTGRWVRKGPGSSGGLILGYRERYRDPHS